MDGRVCVLGLTADDEIGQSIDRSLWIGSTTHIRHAIPLKKMSAAILVLVLFWPSRSAGSRAPLLLLLLLAPADEVRFRPPFRKLPGPGDALDAGVAPSSTGTAAAPPTCTRGGVRILCWVCLGVLDRPLDRLRGVGRSRCGSERAGGLLAHFQSNRSMYRLAGWLAGGQASWESRGPHPQEQSARRCKNKNNAPPASASAQRP